MHSMIPLSYNGGQLYTIKSLFSISNPLLCRSPTFRVEYVVMPQRVMIIACEPSIAVNKGIERILRKLFYGPNTPRHGIHIFVDYLDDSQVHIPSFWIPPQITRLTILYRHRSWVFDRMPDRRSRYCDCERPTVDRQVDRLSITGGTPDLTRGLITPLNEWKCLSSLITDIDIDLPVASGISVIKQNDPLQYETVEPDFARRVMLAVNTAGHFGSTGHTLVCCHISPYSGTKYIPFRRLYQPRYTNARATHLAWVCRLHRPAYQEIYRIVQRYRSGRVVDGCPT